MDPLMLLDRDVCINIQTAINVTPYSRNWQQKQYFYKWLNYLQKYDIWVEALGTRHTNALLHALFGVCY